VTYLPTRTLLAALLISCSGAQAYVGAGAGTGPGTITVKQRIEAHMGFLASDALRGRETGTIAGDITATYVASVLQGLGLTPAGDPESFTQSYPLHRSYLDMDAVVLSIGAEEPFVPLDDFGLRGLGVEPLDLVGGVVFAGHGVVDGESGIDQLAGLDVGGHFVAVLSGVPEGFDGLSKRIDSSDKRDIAQKRGALGLIVLSAEDDDGASRTRRWVRRSMTHSRMELVGVSTDEKPSLVRIYPEPDVAARLFAAAGRDFTAEVERRADEPLAPGFLLQGVELTLNASVKIDELEAHNVAALLPGSDPELAHEVIVVSAHMDHVGVSSDGAVHNGADDNASGTSTLLSVAETLASREVALRRSVLFLAVSGEEKGLLGSEWWVDHPTLPIENVIADINIDMVGRNDPDSVGATPSPEHTDYNSLVVEAVELGPQMGLSVSWSAGEGEYRRRVDSYYNRSDHANFAEKGIPVVFFFSGEHEDYHRPGDTLDKIDFDKIAKVAGLVSALVSSVAEADGRPVRLVD
jgi:hypothetical protein